MIKKIAKKIPGIPKLYNSLQNYRQKRRLKGKSPEAVFSEIYHQNEWGSNESISGFGSEFIQTKIIIEKLPELFKELKISSMLDVPCGDFNWMKKVDRNGIYYIGGDIVEGLIESNNAKYKSETVTFRKLNLLEDEIPPADLIFCRDCLVHFSFDNIFRAFKNIAESDAKYLLTTTFVECDKNEDIVTGQWRAINLQKAPFLLPEPVLVINEGCTEADGKYADKSLGLWRLEDIRRAVK